MIHRTDIICGGIVISTLKDSFLLVKQHPTETAGHVNMYIRC